MYNIPFCTSFLYMDKKKLPSKKEKICSKQVNIINTVAIKQHFENKNEIQENEVLLLLALHQHICSTITIPPKLYQRFRTFVFHGPYFHIKLILKRNYSKLLWNTYFYCPAGQFCFTKCWMTCSVFYTCLAVFMIT